MLFALLMPLLVQASAAGTIDRPDHMPPTLEEDRLSVCLKQANGDPSTAIITANLWIAEAQGAERSFPQQCLGMAYTRLLRWKAAEEAFLTARDEALETDPLLRSRLASMAGNSALADGRNEDALKDLALASSDAALAGGGVPGGEVQIDRSRALVALGRIDEAETALASARSDAPQNANAWLLSATLARRKGDLATASSEIETAAKLDPANPAIALEAGVIAVLSGKDDAAQLSWQAVLASAPTSPEAETARGYLAQLDQPAPDSPPNQPETEQK